MLLTFRRQFQPSFMTVYSSKRFTQAELQSAAPIDCRGIPFISGDHPELISSCRKEHSLPPYLVDIKCYVPAETGKPSKLEQKLFVFMPEEQR